jgi:hypothetical protein
MIIDFFIEIDAIKLHSQSSTQKLTSLGPKTN